MLRTFLKRLTRLSSFSTASKDIQPVEPTPQSLTVPVPGQITLPARPMNTPPYKQHFLQKYLGNFFRDDLWTPAIREVQLSLEFMEGLEFISEKFNLDPRSPGTKEKDLKLIADLAINDSFTEEEKNFISIHKDVHLSSIHSTVEPDLIPGREQIDYVITNEETMNTVFVFFSKRRMVPDKSGSYFPIDKDELPRIFEGLSSLGVDLDKSCVLLTNGHSWEISEVCQGELNQTPPIGPEVLLHKDIKRASVIQGMIRYKLIRQENEVLYDETLKLWNQIKSRQAYD